MEETALIDAAMQMILCAGDARNHIKEALDAIMQEEDEKAMAKMQEGKKALEAAHRCQTQFIQKEANGEPCEYSMLFTHAQDTLMTIYSEYHLAEKMIVMVRMLNEKIAACR